MQAGSVDQREVEKAIEAEESRSAAEQAERTDKDMEEEDWDTVRLLAWTALLLPGLSNHRGAVNCLNDMGPPGFFTCLAAEERD